VLAGVYEGYERDLVKAEVEFKKAIELNPNYPSAHQWYAQLLGMQNRFDEAREQIYKALELSPLSLIINANIADDHYYRGEYDQGIEQSKRVIDMDPNFPMVYPTLIQLYLAAGKADEALRALGTYEKLAGADEADLTRAYISAHAGKPEEARKILERLEASRSTKGTSSFVLGVVRFLLGDNDRGFELLEEAYRRHERYVLMMGIQKELDGVRSDPRYLEMLRKVGLAGNLRP
jgi:lipopolysaccharide biosynthesis regulator YciM